jgi:hypothetical protein
MMNHRLELLPQLDREHHATLRIDFTVVFSEEIEHKSVA